MLNVSAPAALAEDGYDAARFSATLAEDDAFEGGTQISGSVPQVSLQSVSALSTWQEALSAFDPDTGTQTATTSAIAAPLATGGTTYTAATTDELKALLDIVQGGDTILLEGGDYAALTYDGNHRSWNGGEVTITAAHGNNPPVFTDRVDLTRVDGLTFDGVHIDSAHVAQSVHEAVLELRLSTNITLRNMTIIGEEVPVGMGMDPTDPNTTRNDMIDGYAYGTGLWADDVDGLIVENVEFQQFQITTLLRRTADVDMSNLHIHDVREGIQFTDVQNLTIRDSLFEDVKVWLPFDDPSYDPNVHDHPDFIQYWGLNGVEEIRDITITNNRFDVAPGNAAQVIFGHLDNAPAGYTATNFTVTDNIITNAHPNSIRLADIDGGLIEHNVLLPSSTAVTYGNQPLILLPGDTQNVHVGSNAWVTKDHWLYLGAADAAELAARNITVDPQLMLSLDSQATNYWDAASPDVWLDSLQAGITTVDPTVPLSAVRLTGTDADDALVGGYDSDTLLARWGDDTLTGSLGGDQFILDARYLDDGDVHTITDLDFDEGDFFNIRFLPGGRLRVTSVDELIALDQRADVTTQVQNQDIIVNVDFGGGTASLVLEGDASLLVGGGSNDDTTGGTGGGSNDDTTGGTGGGSSDDTTGGTGGGSSDDTTGGTGGTQPGISLHGGSGDDILQGTQGEDTLLARWGQDTLTGDAGGDQFILDARYMIDGDMHTITDLDFDEGDTIEVRFLEEGSFKWHSAADIPLSLLARTDLTLVAVGNDLRVDVMQQGQGLEVSLIIEDHAWILG